MIRKSFLIAAAAAVTLSTAAYAAVSFDEVTGSGFVGKGDIQLLTGWNNVQAQQRIPGITFSTESTEAWGYECEWFTGPVSNRTRHTGERKSTSAINSSVAFGLRTNKVDQITGINLLTYGATVVTGNTVPQVGDACPGGPGTGAVVIAVDDAPESSTSSGLLVTIEGTTYPLPNTPVI